MKETRILFLGHDGFMTEPMGIMLLSALAKQDRPHRTTRFARINMPGEVSRMVADYKPNLVAASMMTGAHTYYLDELRKIKAEFGETVVCVAGGPHCSTHPEVIQKEPCLDAIGIYECDASWPAFLDAMESRNGMDDIRGIVTRGNAERVLQKNSDDDVALRSDWYAPITMHLDSLPYLDRKLIEGTSFMSKTKRSHMAGRGCVNRCAYCFNPGWHTAYGGLVKLPRFSPRRFCEELAELVRTYDTRFLKLYDDVFPTYKKDIPWLVEFAEIYPRMVGLPFHCLTRCDLVAREPKVLELLKKAGVASISMSVESGNPFIGEFVITRDMKDGEMETAFAMARKLGIKTFANTILGIPAPFLVETTDSDFEAKTADVLKKLEIMEPGIGGRKARLFFSPEWMLAVQREDIVALMRKIGLQSSQLEYDKESCWFNFRNGISFGEFPILFPYPRTPVTRYLIRTGAFDGDFDKLPQSYQSVSVLECFSKEEKDVQRNLSQLATFTMLFTGSDSRVMNMIGRVVAWLSMNVFAHITHRWATATYTLLCSTARTYMHETRIYPMKRSFREKVRFWGQMFGLDILKQYDIKNADKGVPESQTTLGGAPPR